MDRCSIGTEPARLVDVILASQGRAAMNFTKENAVNKQTAEIARECDGCCCSARAGSWSFFINKHVRAGVPGGRSQVFVPSQLGNGSWRFKSPTPGAASKMCWRPAVARAS